MYLSQGTDTLVLDAIRDSVSDMAENTQQHWDGIFKVQTISSIGYQLGRLQMDTSQNPYAVYDRYRSLAHSLTHISLPNSVNWNLMGEL